MTMDLLGQLLGGGQQRQQYQDFADRYSRGAPWDDISDQEAVDRYQQVAPHLPPDVYQQSAQEAFARLSPQQRMQVGQYMQQQATQRGCGGFQDRNRDGIDDRYQDPGYMAQMAGRMEQQQPGLLRQILGAALGGGGGGISGGFGGGSGGGGQGMLANPLAKAVLAGIAAQAVSRAMGGATAGTQSRSGGASRSAGGQRVTGYRIANLASRKLLANAQASRDNGTQIIQWDNTGGAEQVWQVEQGPNGGVRLRNGASGLLLANPQGSTANGTAMIQWQDTGDRDQEWTLEQGSRGGVRVRNMASGLLLANPQGSRSNGTVMIQWQDTGDDDQEWLFDPPLR